MNLNRTPDPLDRNAKNGENTNWTRIEGKTKELDNRIDKIVDEVSDVALDKVVDNAKLNWKEPVNNFNSLPSNAQEGDTRMDKSTGKVYRYDGTKWIEIQQIDAGPVNELDSRLTSQLNETNSQLAQEASKRNEASKNIFSGGKERKTLVAIITDDGSKQEWTRIKALLDEKGVKFGTGIITSTVNTDGNLSWDQIRTLKNEGHDILFHSHDHINYTTLTEEEMELDIKTGLSIFSSNGLRPSGFVYPENAHNPNTRKIVSRYFPYAFAKTSGPFSQITRNYPVMNNQAIARMAVGSFFDNPVEGLPSDTSSLEYYKARVDESKANKNLLVLVLHPWHSDHTENQQQYFSDLIDYIKNEDIPIVTPSEAFDIYGNTIEINKPTGENILRIDADGNVQGLKDYIIEAYGARSASDSYTSYPRDTVIVTPYTRQQAVADDSIPSVYEGKMTTCRAGSNTYDVKRTYEEFQSLLPSGYRAKTYEQFVDSQGAWSSWKIKGELFFDVISAPFTIDAHNTSDVELEANGVLLQDIITVMPFNPTQIPTGVIVTLLQTNSNKVILRLANVTTSTKNIGEIRWAITVKTR